MSAFSAIAYIIALLLSGYLAGAGKWVPAAYWLGFAGVVSLSSIALALR